MIVQTIMKNAVIQSGMSEEYTVTTNRCQTGHLVTFQIQGLVLEESDFSLQGRLHSNEGWCLIDLGVISMGNDVILRIPLCEQYKLIVENFQLGPLTVSAWIAN